MNKNYDVAVVGGGIVGLSLVLGLARQGLRVALIDKASLNKRKMDLTHYSPRVSAISAASEKLFTSLDVWKHIARKQAYQSMHVWDKDGFGNICFGKANTANASMLLNKSQKLNLLCEDALGHIIENDIINDALYGQIQTYNNVDCFEGCVVSHMQVYTDKMSPAGIINSPQHDEIKSIYAASLSFHSISSPEDKQTISAKLLVGADGGNSKVRETFGFKHTFWDYSHDAIVANVTTEAPHNNTARQVFTPFGPLAFLPLPDPHQSSIVFSQSSARAQELMALPTDDFEKTLRVAINNNYGSVKLNTQRFSFVLTMRYARQWTSKHVALIGDAAHTIHPLAGQGANLGLGDVHALLTLLKQYPEKIGQSFVLRKYERQRKAEAVKVIATMQLFKELFDGEQAPKKWVRNMGLLGAEKLPGVKAFFMRQAMG